MNRLFLVLLTIFVQPVILQAAPRCTTLLNNPPRGVQCLHCTHPNAKASATGLLEATLMSCQKNIAFAFVLDSSFGSNFAIISEFADSLIQNDRQPYFHLYFLNGPAQRRYRDGVFPESPFQINPFEFREKISSNSHFRSVYLEHVQKFAPLLQELADKGVIISISPMLEDNFDDASFNEILSLTKSGLPRAIDFKFVRSTCSDCFIGNGRGIPAGVSREEHRADLNFQFKEGVISNDGWGYIKFPGDIVAKIPNPVSHKDGRVEKIIELKDLKGALSRAKKNRNMLLVWFSKYQGTLPGNRSANVDKRRYPAPSKAEKALISKFLDS